MRRDRFPSYEEKFLKFSLFIERWILLTIFLLLLSLAITQALLHMDSLRIWLVEVEKLEGVAS